MKNFKKYPYAPRRYAGKMPFLASGKDAPPWGKKAIRAYYHQRCRCYSPNSDKYYAYGAKGIGIEYTLPEFVEWFRKNMPRGSLKQYAIGRKDHSKNYSLTNIEFVTKSENTKERIRRVGTTKPRKKVIAIDRNGNILGRYPSINPAAAGVGCDRGTVFRLLRTGAFSEKFQLYLREDVF